MGLEAGLGAQPSRSEVPSPWLLVLLLILTAITLFRKELSTNHTHRRKLKDPAVDLVSLTAAALSSWTPEYSIYFPTKLPSLTPLPYRSATPPPLGPLVDDCVHIVLTYLSPRDIALSVAPASRSLRDTCRSDELWLVLFHEHFEGLISFKEEPALHRRRGWRPLFQAIERSVKTSGVAPKTPHVISPPDSIMSWKMFYHVFAQAWLDYSVAGHCSVDSCLVGLFGSAVLLPEAFLDWHPGSLETILHNAGKDCTKFFTDLGHSVFARGILQGSILGRQVEALTRGVVVESGDDGEGRASSSEPQGGQPPSSRSFPIGLSAFYASADERASASANSGSAARRTPEAVVVRGSVAGCGGEGNLKSAMEYMKVGRKAAESMAPPEYLADTHFFFDPIVGCWDGWYADREKGGEVFFLQMLHASRRHLPHNDATRIEL